jgi:hypothetical protein
MLMMRDPGTFSENKKEHDVTYMHRIKHTPPVFFLKTDLINGHFFVHNALMLFLCALEISKGFEFGDYDDYALCPTW